MLILSRSSGEALRIGDSISVVVLGIKGNQVRIGIQAPNGVPVHREEIYLRIQREQTDVAHRSNGFVVGANPSTKFKPIGSG